MSEADHTQNNALAIERITVQPDRLELLVRVTSKDYVYTTPALIDQVVRVYPLVLHHSCRNNKGPTFAAVANHTSLPHLLEHIIVDIQTCAAEVTLSTPAQQAVFNSEVPVSKSCEWAAAQNQAAPQAELYKSAGAETRSHPKTPVFVGTTQWDTEDRLLAHVHVSFIDDIQALAAVKEAVTFLNAALTAVE